MATIKQLQYLVSQLRQKRYYVEQRVAHIAAMLPACLILRYRQRHKRSYESIQDIRKGAITKSYAYLTFMDAGQNRHRYVPKERIGEVAQLTETYKAYSQQMQHIRQLNKRIVDVLEAIARLQTKEVDDYVFSKQTRIIRNSASKRTKPRGTTKGIPR